MKGHLAVGDGHSIYFEVIGPKNAKPFVYFHGGPGLSFSKRHQRFFDKKKHRVLFFDQRGCGKSTFQKLLRNNTTPQLVSDTLKLMDHIGMKKAVMVGHSWGSTMALAVAITAPRRTLGVVAASIFLADHKSINYLYTGGAENFIPEAFSNFISRVPARQRKSPIKFYYKIIKREYAAQSKKPLYAREFNLLSGAAMFPGLPRGELIQGWRQDSVEKSLHMTMIESHFMAHQCFLPRDFILNNARRLNKFPVSILHGFNDLLCPIGQAYALHQRIRKSTFTTLDCGHSTRAAVYSKAVKEAIKNI